jgi:hypothetical protein
VAERRREVRVRPRDQEQGDRSQRGSDSRRVPSRRSLLQSLAAVARRLSNDELRVLLAIGNRAWSGQSRYGCLRLSRDRRDFRREAFEEACDAAFYLAAALLSAQTRRAGHRKHGRATIERPSSRRSIVRG